MANVNLTISNPTGAVVTVNAQSVPARKVATLVIADTGADAYGFLAAGCAIVSVSAQADLSKRVEAAYRLSKQLHAG